MEREGEKAELRDKVGKIRYTDLTHDPPERLVCEVREEERETETHRDTQREYFPDVLDHKDRHTHVHSYT